MKQTAVEFLAEKYNFLIWLRNRDEISAAKADELRKQFYEQARQMEQDQIIEAAEYHCNLLANSPEFMQQCLKETFK
jgi:hypothetical protein